MFSQNKISGTFNKALFWRVFLWGFAIIVCMIVAFGPERANAQSADEPCVLEMGKPFTLMVKPQLRLQEIPLERFGPIIDPVVIPSNTNIKYTRFFDVRATINAIGSKQALLSRDENGQEQSGHLTLFLDADGKVTVRNQGPAGAGTVTLAADAPVVVGQPFRVGLTIGPAGLFLYLDGEQIGYSEEYWPLSGNDLPLVIGDTCWGEKRDACRAADRQSAMPFDGTIEVDLYRSEVMFISGMGVS
jgi:hypothetical protein